MVLPKLFQGLREVYALMNEPLDALLGDFVPKRSDLRREALVKPTHYTTQGVEVTQFFQLLSNCNPPPY